MRIENVSTKCFMYKSPSVSMYLMFVQALPVKLLEREREMH